MPQEQIGFTGVHGGELAGVLDVPDGRARSWAVFAHCFTCSKDSHAASRISRALAARGVGVLRFDFTGLGASGGEFADATFTSDVDDLVAAAGVLRERGRAPSLLVGHSLGGAAVLAAAGRIPEVRAVATVNAPADPSHAAHLLDDVSDELAAEGTACVRIGGRSFTVRQAFLDDLGSQAQRDRVADLDAALLVLHAPEDEVVGLDHARRLFELARHPKSFVVLDGADHLLSRRSDSLYAADVISAWASRYLDVAEPTGRPPDEAPDDETPDDEAPDDEAPDDEAPDDETPHDETSDDDAAPSDGVVVVTETLEGPFTQQVRAGRHTWTADEPPEVPGGLDTGPTPYDHLLAGLGTCTAMTMRMYASRKKLPLDRVTVTLRQEHVHADDLTACVEGGDGKEGGGCVRQFVREIDLEGDLDDDQRGRLLAIADKCPVHRTLERGVEVVTRLAR